MLWIKVNKAFWFPNLVIIESRIRIGINKMPVHNTAAKNSLLLCHKRILERQEYNTDTLFSMFHNRKKPHTELYSFLNLMWVIFTLLMILYFQLGRPGSFFKLQPCTILGLLSTPSYRLSAMPLSNRLKPEGDSIKTNMRAAAPRKLDQRPVCPVTRGQIQRETWRMGLFMLELTITSPHLFVLFLSLLVVGKNLSACMGIGVKSWTVDRRL